MRSRSLRLACSASLSAALLSGGCGGDPDDPDATTAAPTTQVDPATTGDPSGTSTTDDTSDPSTSTGTPTTDPDVTGDPVTTGGPSGTCDPAMSPFSMQASGLQASIQIDFDAPGCAAANAAGSDPQVVLDVQPSGLVDATLFGLEIVSVSSGQPFDDPPAGDSEVIDLSPDLGITFEATRVGDGAPVTISFEIFSTGPTLLDVEVIFG